MGKVRLLDGSFATALLELGFDANSHAMWTAEATKSNPKLVSAVYKKFLEAGVDIITSNTYHGCEPYNNSENFTYNPDVFIGEAINLLRTEVTSVVRNVTVLGSISCFGATLRNASEYHGNYVDEIEGIEEKMTQYYRKMFALLKEYGISDVIVETVPALLECDSILTALSGFDITAVVCFTCKDEKNLRHGESLVDAVDKILASEKITGIGINCTDAKNVPVLLSSIIGHTKNKDVFVYPNCGFESQTLFSDLSRTELTSQMKTWIDRGATVVGGCCGTSPSVISLMRDILDNELS